MGPVNVFLGKDPGDLFSTLLRLQHRIEGVRASMHRNDGKILCPKCRTTLVGPSDWFADVGAGSFGQYIITCHLCGERVDEVIFRNWVESEFKIKIEMGLRTRKEYGMRRCKACFQEKSEAEFNSFGANKLKSICRECEGQRKLLADSKPLDEGVPTEDLARVLAAIRKTAERDGAKKLAQELIQFLSQRT